MTQFAFTVALPVRAWGLIRAVVVGWLAEGPHGAHQSNKAVAIEGWLRSWLPQPGGLHSFQEVSNKSCRTWIRAPIFRSDEEEHEVVELIQDVANKLLSSFLDEVCVLSAMVAKAV